MNKKLFDSMQKQMNPSPEARAALAEKLARPAKRRVPVRKYVAAAACAALVIGGVSVYRLYQDEKKWALITQNFHHDAYVEQQHLHSYVLVDGLETSISLNGNDTTEELNLESGVEDSDSGGTADRNTNASSATESAPTAGKDNDRPFISQEEAIKLYDILWEYFCKQFGQQEKSFDPNWPDWYGGGYLNNDRPGHIARLTIVLVKDSDTPALRQEIYDFLGSDHVDFQSGKYSLSYLRDLQTKIVDHPAIRGVFAGCGTDEKHNRLDLTLTAVTDEVLIVLAELDPEDDAIYVQTGQRITLDVAVDMDEDAVTPGGAVIPEGDESLIAEEPWVDSRDGACYSVEHLQKQPAVVQSVPEEESFDPWTAVTYDPRTGETIPVTACRDSDGSSENPEGTSGGTRAYNLYIPIRD